MHRSRGIKIKTVVSLVSMVLMLLGCVRATPIRKILDDPRDYAGKPVTIAGKVTEVTGLVFFKYFVVKDKTGEITVVTSRPLPKEGAEIRVTGTVQEAFAIGDKQFIVIIESEPAKPS